MVLYSVHKITNISQEEGESNSILALPLTCLFCLKSARDYSTLLEKKNLTFRLKITLFLGGLHTGCVQILYVSAVMKQYVLVWLSHKLVHLAFHRVA